MIVIELVAVVVQVLVVATVKRAIVVWRSNCSGVSHSVEIAMLNMLRHLPAPLRIHSGHP